MRTLFSIDAHAAGEPTRIITGGLPPLRGRTAGEMRSYLQDNMDWVRKCLTLEPRGHSDMFGAVLADNHHPNDLYSLIFFDTGGYLNGCGHGTICSTVVWSRLHGLPETPYHVRNPDGSVTVVERIEKKGESGCRATLLMPPASVIRTDIALDEVGVEGGALAYCGNHYVLFEAASVGLSPLREMPAKDMRDVAGEIAGSATVEATAPLGNGKLEVMFYERLRETAPVYSTAVVFSNRQLDRSPCGTGSCALFATLVESDAIDAGQAVHTVGPTGARFELLRSERADGNGDMRVQLTGDAFITGIHEWVLDDGDPMAGGFRID